jgi:hypothetical protein
MSVSIVMAVGDVIGEPKKPLMVICASVARKD